MINFTNTRLFKQQNRSRHFCLNNNLIIMFTLINIQYTMTRGSLNMCMLNCPNWLPIHNVLCLINQLRKFCFKILIPILIIIVILFKFHDNTNFYQVSLAMSCDLKLTGSLQLQYLRAHYRYASDFSASQLWRGPTE